MEDKNVLVQLAIVTEQLSTLKVRFESVERKIDNLVSLGSSIAELEAHREDDMRERELLWTKIKEVGGWQPTHETKVNDHQRSIALALDHNSKSFSEACNTIEKKVDGWINKFKGAFWVIGLLFTLFQGLGAWYFVSTTGSIVNLQERMNKVEVQLAIDSEVKKRLNLIGKQAITP